MWVIHIKVVATDALLTLQLTTETVANALMDGPESRFFCTDPVKFINLYVDLIPENVSASIASLNLRRSHTKRVCSN
jgi:hypothetical protein